MSERVEPVDERREAGLRRIQTAPVVHDGEFLSRPPAARSPRREGQELRAQSLCQFLDLLDLPWVVANGQEDGLHVLTMNSTRTEAAAMKMIIGA